MSAARKGQMPMRVIANVCVLLVAAPLALAQVTTLHYPPLTLSGSSLAARVTYDPSTRIYRYEYTVNAAPANKASIAGFSLDIAARSIAHNSTPLCRTTSIARNAGRHVSTACDDPGGHHGAEQRMVRVDVCRRSRSQRCREAFSVVDCGYAFRHRPQQVLTSCQFRARAALVPLLSLRLCCFYLPRISLRQRYQSAM